MHPTHAPRTFAEPTMNARLRALAKDETAYQELLELVESIDPARAAAARGEIFIAWAFARAARRDRFAGGALAEPRGAQASARRFERGLRLADHPRKRGAAMAAGFALSRTHA